MTDLTALRARTAEAVALAEKGRLDMQVDLGLSVKQLATDLAAWQARCDRQAEQMKQLREALLDCSGGLKYIRQQHGDLYGVGFDRALGKADEALAATEVE